jgi:hypothetical protein
MARNDTNTTKRAAEEEEQDTTTKRMRVSVSAVSEPSSDEILTENRRMISLQLPLNMSIL